MVLSVWVKQIKQLVLVIIGLVRRAMCCFRRRRYSDAGNSVPLATVGVIPDTQLPHIQSGTGEAWDEWGRGLTVREQIEDYRYRQQQKPPAPSQPPPEFYFQDMEPTIKTQARVVIQTKTTESESRLLPASDFPPTSAELETWEESKRTGWEEAENWGLSAAEKLKQSRKPLAVKQS